MQEVSYHISVGLSARLHRKKKEPCPTLPFLIRLYKIRNLKHADAKIEEFKKFPFSTRSFNQYDPHCFVKDHCVRVQFLWIHVACHWVEEDPWRYCHSFSKPNESVGITVEWLSKQCEAASKRPPAVEVNIPARDKGKRKILDRVEVEKSYKFKANPLAQKETWQ